IKHTTGIPHSSTGQSIVERAHRPLKTLLERQKGGVEVLSTVERLNKAMFVFNFLNNSFMEQMPPIFRHFGKTAQAKLKERLPAFIKDPETGQVLGPYPLI
ncbi:POK10 protein, partial [Zosterops hypoxanthus]|nr:POK10 protein [Zosterops hypoxanthus]